jgi:signal transduction histidine kinase
MIMINYQTNNGKFPDLSNIKVQGFDMIARNAERLSQLSSDILDVTKIEGNSLELQKEQLDLNKVLLNTVEIYKKQITKTNIDIKIFFEPHEEVILVEVDMARIIQVIANLLNNAIKFTRSEGGTVTVKVQKKDYDTYGEIKKDSNTRSTVVTVNIKDTGSNIDPDIMPRLFQKFASKSFQGTGLGLFISKNIVEAHGGKIWGGNNFDGKGATFYFTLPTIGKQIKSSNKDKISDR